MCTASPCPTSHFSFIYQYYLFIILVRHGLELVTICPGLDGTVPELTWSSWFDNHHHHHSPEPARDRRVTQSLRFLAFSQSTPALMPLSASSCLIQVLRGWPWRWVQLGLGFVPEHMLLLSLRAMWAGTFAGSLLFWPKREWRLLAMVSLMSARPVLSETVILMTNSVQRTLSSRRWHLTWKACSFLPSSMSGVQVSEPHTTRQVGHKCCRRGAWRIDRVACFSTPCRVVLLWMLSGRYDNGYLEMSTQMNLHRFRGK